MTLTETLLTGVKSFFRCSIPIRTTFVLIPIAFIFQLSGIGTGSWSGSDQSRQGLWKYCYDSGDFSCCEDITDKLGTVPENINNINSSTIYSRQVTNADLSRSNTPSSSDAQSIPSASPAAIISKRGEPLVGNLQTVYVGNIGDDITLECTVESYPKENKVYWKKHVHGQMCDIDYSLPEYSRYNQISPLSSMLHIHNIQHTDDGIYQCFAENGIGTGRSQNIALQVKDIPLHWSLMEDFENLKIVELQFGDEEYNKIGNEFLANMGQNYVIAKVERIQNIQLYIQYLAEKKLIESINPTGRNEERNLWHGTNLEAVYSINMQGFNRSFCGANGVLYGQGCYFAVSPAYSASYANPDLHGYKRMYLCKVLVGEYIIGDTDMRVPPPISEGSQIRYNSLVNNAESPTIFVVFRDPQAYPEYLITFM